MSKKTTAESPLDLGQYITQQTGTNPTQATGNTQSGQKNATKKIQRATKVKRNSDKTNAQDFNDELTSTLIENFIRYDRISGNCLPVTIPIEVSEKLQEFVKKYHRRLSARTIVTALIETFISDYDGDSVMRQFLDRIHYIEPTDKEIEARERNARKAREQRARKNTKE